MTVTQEQIDDWNAARKRRQERAGQADEEFRRVTDLLPAARYAVRRHTIYHYSINRLDHGKVLWRMNLYPSTGKIWCDPNFDDPPELSLPRPWRLEDVVAELAKLDARENDNDKR